MDSRTIVSGRSEKQIRIPLPFRLERGEVGFTLVELVIAMSILGILASIALPNYQNFLAPGKPRQSSRFPRFTCLSGPTRPTKIPLRRQIFLTRSSCDWTTSGFRDFQRKRGNEYFEVVLQYRGRRAGRSPRSGNNRRLVD
jgi:prepilin-type N-terminal cleavage/methylation domain-containing protein